MKPARWRQKDWKELKQITSITSYNL